MRALNTLEEAKAAGGTHLCFLCEECRRSSSIMIDVVMRKTPHRTIDDVQAAFKCKRCNRRPDRVMVTEPDSKGLHYFNYVVAVWNDVRLEVDHVEAASMHLEDIRPAFRLSAKRFSKRWVTIQSRDAVVGDSDRFEVLDEVDM